MEELYKTYYESAKSSDLKKDEKVFLCNFFKNLKDNDDKEALYMLIYYYYERSELGESSELIENPQVTEQQIYPYKSVKNKLRGVDFPLSKLPYKLRNMLYNFCKVLERKEEDETVILSVKRTN